MWEHKPQQSEELVRRAKNRVQPPYPELAKKMNLAGTVKIEVTVSTNGSGAGSAGGGWTSGSGECGAGRCQEVAL